MTQLYFPELSSCYLSPCNFINEAGRQSVSWLLLLILCCSVMLRKRVDLRNVLSADTTIKGHTYEADSDNLLIALFSYFMSVKLDWSLLRFTANSPGLVSSAVSSPEGGSWRLLNISPLPRMPHVTLVLILFKTFAQQLFVSLCLLLGFITFWFIGCFSSL